MYINIHTHKETLAQDNCLQVLSFYSHFQQATSGSYCTIGLHPWYLQDHDLNFNKLKQYAAYPNVLAIGECGLDRTCNSDFEIQEITFRKQIILAKVLSKPLVLHCVKSYNDVLRMLKEQKFNQAVIFHGYNKNATLAKQLVQQGFYISFGATLLKNPKKMEQVLNSISIESLFLETDDTDISIIEIYLQAANLLHINLQNLILQIEHNFQKAFNRTLQ